MRSQGACMLGAEVQQYKPVHKQPCILNQPHSLFFSVSFFHHQEGKRLKHRLLPTLKPCPNIHPGIITPH